jgi:hypothetical protein
MGTTLSATAAQQRKELNNRRHQVDFDTYDVTVDELLRRVEGAHRRRPRLPAQVSLGRGSPIRTRRVDIPWYPRTPSLHGDER